VIEASTPGGSLLVSGDATAAAEVGTGPKEGVVRAVEVDVADPDDAQAVASRATATASLAPRTLTIAPMVPPSDGLRYHAGASVRVPPVGKRTFSDPVNAGATVAPCQLG
jgi:hypothetical protein